MKPIKHHFKTTVTQNHIEFWSFAPGITECVIIHTALRTNKVKFKVVKPNKKAKKHERT